MTSSQNRPFQLAVALTLMLTGRAMTLMFIADAGSGKGGAPPDAWLMPLIGDAVIGLTGFVVAYLLLKHKTLWAWTAAVSWNVLGIWDALSAFIIHQTNPWPDFFMIEIFGSSMFFMASAMHLAIIVILSRDSVKASYLKNNQ